MIGFLDDDINKIGKKIHGIPVLGTIEEIESVVKKVRADEALIAKDLIYEVVKIKVAIVDVDPEEKNIRKTLNFGHTIGHAIESHFMETTAIAHGHAVALGICGEAYLSMKKKMLSLEDYKQIEKIIKSNFREIFSLCRADKITIETNKDSKESLSDFEKDVLLLKEYL